MKKSAKLSDVRLRGRAGYRVRSFVLESLSAFPTKRERESEQIVHYEIWDEQHKRPLVPIGQSSFRTRESAERYLEKTTIEAQRVWDVECAMSGGRA